MPPTKQIQNGNFQDELGNALNGALLLVLSQDAKIISGGQVAPKQIRITVSGGNIPTTSIYFNDELAPSGTYYKATIYDSSGNVVYGPENWQLVGAGPVDVGTITPVATAIVSFPAPALLNPAPPGQTFTGTSIFPSLVTPTIGPSTSQQHTLPAVASDTIALLSASQTLTNKTFSSPTSTGTDSGVEILQNKTLTKFAFGIAAFPSSTQDVTGQQNANADDVLTILRNTDTSPAGNFLRFRNAAANADLFTVDVTGKGLANGNLFTAPFGASGASHSVGLVPDPGSTAGTTRFLREDATWAAASGGVTEGTMQATGSMTGSSAVCSLANNNCMTYVFPNAHTLIRVVVNVATAPVGCSTNAAFGVKDGTSGSVLGSVTPTATGVTDSGALSVPMTAGDKILIGIMTTASGCTTNVSGVLLSAIYN